MREEYKTEIYKGYLVKFRGYNSGVLEKTELILARGQHSCSGVICSGKTKTQAFNRVKREINKMVMSDN